MDGSYAERLRLQLATSGGHAGNTRLCRWRFPRGVGRNRGQSSRGAHTELSHETADVSELRRQMNALVVNVAVNAFRLRGQFVISRNEG